MKHHSISTETENCTQQGYLRFPTSWNLTSLGTLRVGKLGDVLGIDSIPESLKVTSFAYSQSFRQNDGGTVVCGSAGEVAPDPTLDDMFEIGGGRLENSNTLQRDTVWTMNALYAPDQLRQRMAFALSQIFALDPQIITARQASEPQIYFYDIFVRNGLGNYGDVMREVSFNPEMAEMLTFIRNKPIQYGWHSSSREVNCKYYWLLFPSFFICRRCHDEII